MESASFKIRKPVSALCYKFPKYCSGFVFSLNTWIQYIIFFLLIKGFEKKMKNKITVMINVGCLKRIKCIPGNCII